MHTCSWEEIAAHNRPDDCWIVVHGGVYDVTSFLSSHPGGVAALSKKGRAGADVTSHFERIGHSASARELLASLQIGIVADHVRDHEAVAGPPGAQLLDEDELEGLAVQWHARRRREILLAHPEVEQLAGDNVATPWIGLGVCVLHAAVCMWVCLLSGWLGIGGALLFGYTVGAWCKMAQFAVCHDVCHGTAGPLCRSRPIQRFWFHLLTLPSIGGETQHYYAYQHIGHHGHLGEDPKQAT